MPARVPKKTVAARRRALEEAQGPITRERLGRFVGREIDVLVEEQVARASDGDEELSLGRAWNQAPDVDGLTVIRGEHRPGSVLRARVLAVKGVDFDAGLPLREGLPLGKDSPSEASADERSPAPLSVDAQPRAARRRPPRGRQPPHPRGRRLGQDAGDHDQDRLSRPGARLRARVHPRRDLHEQGRPGDARPRDRHRGLLLPRRHAHLPFLRGLVPAAQLGRGRARPQLHHLRRRRPDDPPPRLYAPELARASARAWSRPSRARRTSASSPTPRTSPRPSPTRACAGSTPSTRTGSARRATSTSATSSGSPRGSCETTRP